MTFPSRVDFGKILDAFEEAEKGLQGPTYMWAPGWLVDAYYALAIYEDDRWLPPAVWEAYEEWLDEPSVSWKLGLGD